MKRLTVRLNHALCPLTEVITVVTKRAIFANLKKQFNVKTFKPQTYGSIKTHESPKLHYQKKNQKEFGQCPLSNFFGGFQLHWSEFHILFLYLQR